MFKSLNYVFFVLIISFLFQGCVAVQSFPTAARAGDTITLAVGSPDGMTKDNTSVAYTPEGGSPVSLPIRSIFKIFPDKTSGLYFPGSGLDFMAQASGHEPWLTVIMIDLPSTLLPGSGIIQVTTTAEYKIAPDINNKTSQLTVIE